MQMPVMAKDVFMGRLSRLAPAAVKSHLPRQRVVSAASCDRQDFIKHVYTNEKRDRFRFSGRVTIWSKSITICSPMEHRDPREENMPVTRNESERARKQYAALATHYRAIGPAAIVAALMHAKKRKVPASAKSAA